MEKVNKFKLEDLGFNDFFAANRQQLGLNNFSVARVIAEHKEAYKVMNERGVFLAKITGKQMFQASSREDYPAVGDWVAITELEPGKAVIHQVLPRETVIKRNFGDKNKSGGKTDIQVIGANIDVAFVVESIDRDYNLNRIDRYLVLVKDGGVRPAIILNKIDLIPLEELDSKLAELKNRFCDLDIFPTSSIGDQGLDKLRKYILPGKTYCFLGSSGVGKSSLINKLIGTDLVRTGSISSASGRGKHVTTSREVYFLESGGIVIDNPGIREVGMTETNNNLENFFDEIAALGESCKYKDCSHIHEPGCSVLEALKTGKLDEDRYRNYVNLKKETEYREMSSLEKRRKDRAFGRFIKKGKKTLRFYE